MNKNKILEEFKKFIENDIKKNYSKTIFQDTFEYTLLSNGKYIRSMTLLILLGENDFDYKNFFDIALAIEMIHTYSLIHDDLPSMDNDDYRRGKLSCHKQFGENVAILTGDALLTHSFEKIITNNYLNEVNKIEFIKELINASGIKKGMINGQLLDILNVEKDITKNDLDIINHQKTGQMIMLPFLYFAKIANKNEKNYKNLGYKIGNFYQLQDDYLDVYGDEKKMGKTKGKDAVLNKKTYANFYSQKEFQILLDEEKKEIKDLLVKEEFPPGAITFVENILEREN